MEETIKDLLIRHFQDIKPLSPAEIQAIKDSMNIQSFPKGHVLLEEGQFSDNIYFVGKGCVRQYMVIEGEEKTTNFFSEGQWVISADSLIEQEAAKHYLSCLEDCQLVIGDDQKAAALYKEYPHFADIGRQIIERAFASQQCLLASYVTLSAEQRYLSLQAARPDLIQRVPQYHLASFIGVKAETLSRIRKRLHQKGK
ncbi:MAG: Crp/Fnr family transcriptional regulator [Bacteroidota bacterium]